MTSISFVLNGPPRTKKNHGRIDTRGRRPRVLPSREFEEWNKIAQQWLAVVRTKTTFRLPITYEVNCQALFYRDALRGDAVGYYQALADALEEAGIVENDRLIVSWDGSRMLKDADNPRVEVLLEIAASGLQLRVRAKGNA